tara:strand:+ start:1054 stop:1278 length:225 start_codon:yes stop_codon:yes gene_type:complete
MKIHELVEQLGLYVDYNKSICNPNDNLALYYLENNVLTNCQFESFFDCNYEDINGVVDYELTIQNTKEYMEENS